MTSWRRALLLAFVIGCGGGESETHSVIQGSETLKLSESEIRSRLASRSLSETAVIFSNNTWVVLRDHPMFREELAAVAKDAAIKRVMHINGENPGERIDVRQHLVPGKTVIFDFYSIYCPPCMAIAPLLNKLAESKPDMVVRKIDINRGHVRGIDWRSPVVNQYGINAVPYFQIFDGDGKLVASGEEASDMVEGWISGI